MRGMASLPPRITQIFSLALLILLLSPMTVLSAQSGQAQPSSSREFTDPAGYRFIIPPGWRSPDYNAKNGHIRADILKNDNAGFQVRLTACDPGGFEKTVESAVRGYKKDMTQHWGGSIEQLKRSTVDAGEEAAIFHFRAERNNGQIWYLNETFIRSGNKLVVFQCGCPWPEREAFSLELEGVIRSIRFTE